MKSHPARIRAHALSNDVESARGSQLGRRVVAFLLARHPLKTAENVAADTGLPVNTVKTWLARESDPSGRAYVRLWLAYGPEFLAATIERAPAWLDAAHRAEEAARLRSEIAAREAELARLTR